MGPSFLIFKNMLNKHAILSLLLLLSLSCTEKNDKSIDIDTKTKTFSVRVSDDNPNFILFEMDKTFNPSSYEWTFPGNVKISNKQSIMHYFEEKGSYQVSLTIKGDTGYMNYTETVTIPQNSIYFSNDETLYWNDEFNDKKLNSSYWNYDLGINKWGNNEMQEYTNSPNNSFLRDGKLVIITNKRGTGQKIGDYTSARVTTNGKIEINRGRVEVRAKLGGGKGIWPAIWMFGRNASPDYSELDIMEYVGFEKNRVYAAVHTSYTLDNQLKITGFMDLDGVEENFYTYGINWTNDKVDFYINSRDNIYLSFVPKDKTSIKHWPFDKKLYLILNVAVGGDWAGMQGVDDNIFPQETEFDYVRIFTKEK